MPQAQHFLSPKIVSGIITIIFAIWPHPSRTSHDDYCHELDSILVVCVCARTKWEIVRDYRRPRVKSVCGRAGAAALIIGNFHLRRDSNSFAARTRHCFMRTQRVKKMALNFLFFLPPSHPPLSRNIDLLRAVSEGKSEKIVWNGRRPREKRKISARPPQRRKKSAFFIREASVPYQEWREKTFFLSFLLTFPSFLQLTEFYCFQHLSSFLWLGLLFFSSVFTAAANNFVANIAALSSVQTRAPFSGRTEKLWNL